MAAVRTVSLSRRVSWSDADSAGVMNSPRAFDYAIEAIEAVWRRALGMTFHELILKHGRGQPFVHAECDYSAPLVEGARLRLIARIERLGASTIHWRVDARRADGRAAFRVRMIASLVRNDTFRAIPIPAAWRRRLAPYVTAPRGARRAA